MTGPALLNVLLLALVALACVWLVTEPLRTRTPDDPDTQERAQIGRAHV